MEKPHEPVIVQVSSTKPLHAIIVLVLIVQSFFLGSLWTKVEVLKQGGVAASPSQAAGGATQQQAQATAPQPQAAATVTLDQVKEVFDKSQIKFGDAKKKLVLIEVADPSCPYCHVAGGLNGSLNKQMGDRFTLVADGGTYVAPIPEFKKLVDQGKAAFAYLYSPGHGNGEMGTKALYCANEKGKFWQVHDLIMTSDGYTLLNENVKNDKAKSSDLAEYLKSAFDPAAMKNCLDSGKYDKRLTDDIDLATNIGISGTPGFYVNTTKFGGAYSYKDMESAVTSALK